MNDIQNILMWESRHGDVPWSMRDVADIANVTLLPTYIKHGLIEKVQDGRVPKYHTTSKVKVFEQQPVEMPRTFTIPDDIFDAIIGLDDIKEMLLMVLKASSPAHICIIGSNSSAKSLLLYCIERRLETKVVYIDCSNATKAGIGADIVANPDMYALLLDEIDKISADDLKVLLGLMSSQRYVSTKSRGGKIDIMLNVRVIAVGNSDNIPESIRERFLAILHLPKYSRQDAFMVMNNVLKYDENVDVELASYIASKVVDELGERNPRIAVQMAHTCKTKEDVDKMVETIKKY